MTSHTGKRVADATIRDALDEKGTKRQALEREATLAAAAAAPKFARRPLQPTAITPVKFDVPVPTQPAPAQLEQVQQKAAPGLVYVLAQQGYVLAQPIDTRL